MSCGPAWLKGRARPRGVCRWARNGATGLSGRAPCPYGQAPRSRAKRAAPPGALACHSRSVRGSSPGSAPIGHQLPPVNITRLPRRTDTEGNRQQLAPWRPAGLTALQVGPSQPSGVLLPMMQTSTVNKHSVYQQKANWTSLEWSSDKHNTLDCTHCLSVLN